MINNVKVLPLGKDRCFKASFSSLEREYLCIVIVLPFALPDNIVRGAAIEARKAISALVKPGFTHFLDLQIQPHSIQTTKEFVQIQKNVVIRLNNIFTDIFYRALTLLSPPTAELANSVFSGSALGVTHRALPALFSGFKESQAPLVCMNLSEKLQIDASEFLNAVYEDMSQINEILTLKDQTLMIEGVALFYKGVPIANSLVHQTYLSKLVMIANLNDMFERTTSEELSVIDYFYVKQLSKHSEDDGVQDLSADIS